MEDHMDSLIERQNYTMLMANHYSQQDYNYKEKVTCNRRYKLPYLDPTSTERTYVMVVCTLENNEEIQVSYQLYREHEKRQLDYDYQNYISPMYPQKVTGIEESVVVYVSYYSYTASEGVVINAEQKKIMEDYYDTLEYYNYGTNQEAQKELYQLFHEKNKKYILFDEEYEACCKEMIRDYRNFIYLKIQNKHHSHYANVFVEGYCKEVEPLIHYLQEESTLNSEQLYKRTALQKPETPEREHFMQNVNR